MSEQENKRTEQCGAVECRDEPEIWVEIGPAPVTVGFCERCGEEVV